MKYINTEYNNTYEEKKSKFIAYLMPYDEYNECMDRLKAKHPKARHFVYAYRYLNEMNQIVENSSDDGEPRGTSGKPSLNVIAGQGLINTAVIIIRYFGGTKLGTGGLVRAYSDAVNLVISEAVLYEYEDLEDKTLIIPYSDLQKIEYLCKNLNISIKNKDFDSNVCLYLESTKERFEELSKSLSLGLHLE
ncbi:MAG: YigZ family protein [Campylobacteraceae bacterium]|nr:YigZ family protein [Campylobacteraceae bacterium]